MAGKTTGGTVTWTLDADSSKLDASLTKAQTGAKKTAQELEKAGESGKNAANKLGTSFTQNLSNIQMKLGGVTAGMESFALKALGVGAAIGGLAFAGVKSAASLEQIEANLFAISGDADFAAEALQKLKQISLDTAGFSTKGLANVTLSLKNVYGTTEEAIKQTEVLARMISATGGSEADLQGVVSALQMITVSGKAGSRQIRQLYNASPLFGEIAAKAGITAEALENAEDPLAMLTKAFGEAAKEGGMLQAAIDRQNSTFNDAWDDLTENFTNKLGEWAMSSGLFDIIKQALNDLMVWLQANGPKIGEQIKNAVGFIMNNKDRIIGAVIAFGAVWAGLKIASAIITLWKLVMALRGLYAIVKGFAIVAPILKVLTTNIGSLAGIGRVLMTVLGALTSVVGLVIAAIAIWAYNIYQIATHWQDFRDLIVAGLEWLAGLASAIYNIAISIVQGLANGLIQGGQMIWNGIKSAADKIGEFFAGAANWLYDTGKNIVQGLINGIKDMAGKVGDTVGNIGSGIKNKFKSILGISSPSKVFAGYGVNIGEGLSEGIKKTVGDVTGTVSVMATNLTQPMAVSNPITTPVVNQQTTNSGITNNIGTINIAKEVDGEKWLQKLNRNTELASNGMVGVTNV